MPVYRLLVGVALVSFARPAIAQDLRFDRLTPEQLEPFVQRILDSASTSLEKLLAQRGPRTVANTLRPYDDYRIFVNRARVVSFIQNEHPDSAVRAAAGRAEVLLETHNRARNDDRRVYDMLAAVDTTRADPEVRYWLRRELNRYHETAIDRSESVRTRVASLQSELDRLERAWADNPRHDTITVAFDSAQLRGMNLAGRRRGPNGELLVAGDELRNVATMAPSAEARKRAWFAHMRMRRNHYVLDTLLRLRHELATVLGYRSYAEYQLKQSMVGSPERARQFLDEIKRLSEPALRRGAEASLAQQAPGGGAREVPIYELIRTTAASSADAGVGPQLRPYLPYERVRNGLFDLAREFMGLEFRPAPDLPVYEQTVEAYRVFENGKQIGNVYLDLHWRPGRSVQGASAANFRAGVKDRVITEAAIVAGMLRPVPGEPMLMGVRPMQTLFHEFGHVLHYLLAVRTWSATSGLPDGFDFREVPSTLFERWATDSAVVSRFARHWSTGEPAPPALLARLAQREEGPNFMGQWISRMSLELHDRPPGDMHAVVRQTFHETLPDGLPVTVTLPEGDIHPEVTLPHFGNGYDAAYYTYLWSQAISLDLLTKFDKGLLDPVAIRAYRTSILEPGRSRPVTEIIEAFLGRPFNLEAWARAHDAR